MFPSPVAPFIPKTEQDALRREQGPSMNNSDTATVTAAEIQRPSRQAWPAAATLRAWGPPRTPVGKYPLSLFSRSPGAWQVLGQSKMLSDRKGSPDLVPCDRPLPNLMARTSTV